MRKMAIVFLLAFVLIAPFMPIAKGAQAVVFDDPVLEAALRDAVGIPQGDVTTKDLANVTSLEIARQYEQNPDQSTQVHSLEALANCKNLTTLKLNFQNITDITPLAKLKKLATLELGGNPIADVAPLAKLTDLETLTLFNCQAQNYASLAKLKKLKTLYLEFSTIADLTPLKKLTKLEALSLKGTLVTDVRPISKLKSLRSLSLADCRIEDYSPLAKIYDKLEQPDFDLSSPTFAPSEKVVFDDPVLETALRTALNRPVGDVYSHELASLTDFGTWFDYDPQPAEGSRVKSVSVLRYCTNLENLDLNFNQIKDITPLAGLTKLKMLGLGGNEIEDIAPLENLTNLELLRLFNCRAEDYSPLSKLTRLQHLALEYSTIADLTPLAGLTELNALSLNNTPVTDVTPLAGLTKLRTLLLAHCIISDFSPLSAIYPQLEDKDFDPTKPVMVVMFSDATLESLIRQAVNQSEGIVTSEQTAQISELSFEHFDNMQDSVNIFDLAAIKYCTGLKQLTLNSIAATDLSALSNLTVLEGLTLHNNPSKDYSALAALKNLRWLDLDGSAIDDLAPLASLTNLEALSLRNTDVSDLAPLQGMSELFGLTLLGSPVKDYSPIASLYPSLGKCDFILPQPGIVTFFDSLLEKRVRKAMNKPDGTITAQEAAAVTQLDLSQDENSSVSIEVLQGLEAFTGLTELNLSGNTMLSDLWPVSGLSNLIKLNCWKCDIKNLKPVSGLVNLQELILGWYGSVGTLDALSGLTNLVALDAKGVGITDISGLRGLNNLQYVGLNANRISDFSPLATLPSLNSAELKDNATDDYSVLAAIYPRLTYKDFELDESTQPQILESMADPEGSWQYDATTKTLTIQSDAAMTAFQPNNENAEMATQTNAPWGIALAQIEQIVVNDGVTLISDYAFAYAGALKQVTIGKDVQSLGWRCLYRCGNWKAGNELNIDVNCSSMPILGNDTLGYTWDNPKTFLMVPADQISQWMKQIGNYALRIEAK